MFGSPYLPYSNVTPNYVIPTPIPQYQTQQPVFQSQPVQSPPIQQQQPSQPSATPQFGWKAVSSYQDVTMESVPIDGTPILCMLQNESVFYIVRMVDGRKLINGFQFAPLDTTVTQPVVEQTVESRLTNVESSINLLSEKITQLLEGKDESYNDNAGKEVKRAAIKQQQ